VWTGSEDQLEEELDRLLEAELIYEKGFLSRRSFLFKHALVQDAAYDSLLVSERRQHHGNIAEALLRLLPESAEERPDVLAHHWAAAERFAEAVPCCLRAGELAMARAALVEAREHFEKGLELLGDAELDDEASGRLEMQLANGLALALMSSEGPGSERLVEVWTRARRLGERLDRPEMLAPVLFGLWMIRVTRRQLEQAGELADACEHLARRLVDPVVELHAHLAQGNTRFWLGDFARTQEHMERARRLLGPEQEASYASRYGQNPRVHAVMFDLYAAFYLGHGERAATVHAELEELVEGTLEHPYNRAIGLQALTIHDFHLGRVEAAGIHARELENLTLEHGFSLFLGIAHLFLGWVEALGGDEAGIERLRQGYHGHTAPAGGLVIHTLYSLLLAQAHEACGQVAEALEALADGLDGASHGDLWDPYTVEALRMKARLLEATAEGEDGDGNGDDDRWPADPRQRALEVARLQGSPLLELRARTDLAEAGDPDQAASLRQLSTLLAGRKRRWRSAESTTLPGYRADLRAAKEVLSRRGSRDRS
ncbi:MAG: hypothetical protein MI919_39245, partial [Holophagales bacterium]|nr:hypothetical protein [Holophagales bacterium]